MKTLEKEILIYGAIAVQIKRVGKIAIYRRTEQNYEVIIIQDAKARVIFNKSYPDREVYPFNEDFGTKGWTFMTLAAAERKFDHLINERHRTVA